MKSLQMNRGYTQQVSGKATTDPPSKRATAGGGDAGDVVVSVEDDGDIYGTISGNRYCGI